MHVPSRRRDCHLTDVTSPSILKHLLKGERGVQQNDSLADGYTCPIGLREREEKEMYYSITAEMILAQPSSYPVTDNPGALASRV